MKQCNMCAKKNKLMESMYGSVVTRRWNDTQQLTNLAITSFAQVKSVGHEVGVSGPGFAVASLSGRP